MTKTTDTDTQTFSISVGIQQLTKASGGNSRDHGFHEDWPVAAPFRNDDSESQRIAAIRRAIAEKIALIHSEYSEALEEIRSGRDPLEIYFIDKDGKRGDKGLEYTEQQYSADGTPLFKPEGFLVELADGLIRTGDLAFLVGDETGKHLAAATAVKAHYNQTRPYKHGRKF